MIISKISSTLFTALLLLLTASVPTKTLDGGSKVADLSELTCCAIHYSLNSILLMELKILRISHPLKPGEKCG